MKFGALPDDALAGIDLRVPPEPFFNKIILPGACVAQPKVYVGAATWGDASWAGRLYPSKTSLTRFRTLYPQQFNAIELNATHYNIYRPDVMQQWAAPARGKNFKFCPKFPQAISHHSGFKEVEIVTHAFIESILSFEDLLGPAFLQLSENFAPAQKQDLYLYLASLPTEATYFLEVRHPLWLSNEEERMELFETLHALNMGAVITDTPGRRDLVHMHLTVPKMMLRFVCNGLHPASFTRTNAWIKRIQHWVANGLEEVYVFLHPGNDAAVPELATYWVTELNKACGLQLQPPRVLQGQLF